MTNDTQNDIFIVTEKGFESLITIRARQKCEAASISSILFGCK